MLRPRHRMAAPVPMLRLIASPAPASLRPAVPLSLPRALAALTRRADSRINICIAYSGERLRKASGDRSTRVSYNTSWR